MILIMLVLFVINWLSYEYISKSIIYFNSISLGGKLVEALLRTGIIVAIGLALIYKFNISKEINEIINKVLRVKSKE